MLPPTDHRAVRGRHDALRARRQFDARAARVWVVRDDCGVVPGGARDAAAVSRLLLQAAHDRTLGHRAHRQDVANLQVGCEHTTPPGEAPHDDTTTLFWNLNKNVNFDLVFQLGITKNLSCK